MNTLPQSIVPFNNEQKMTSLEISELVEKRHDNVKRTIESLVKSGVIHNPQIEDCGRINGLGVKQSFEIYVFTGEQGKRDSIVVVAQLCPEFTARLVDRWQELEAQVAAPRELSKIEILQLAMESEQRAISLQSQVEFLEPKANALDTLSNADGTVTLDQAAKLLGVQPKKFLNPWLIDHGWCFRRSGDINPHQDKVDKKLLKPVYRTYQSNSGEQRTTVQTRVTSSGMTKLAMDLKKWQDAQVKGDVA